MAWLRDLRVLWNARAPGCGRVAWTILIALRSLPWPGAERLLQASFRIRVLVRVRDLRRALGELLADFTARHPEQCALVAFARGADAHVPDGAPRKRPVSSPTTMKSEA